MSISAEGRWGLWLKVCLVLAPFTSGAVLTFGVWLVVGHYTQGEKIARLEVSAHMEERVSTEVRHGQAARMGALEKQVESLESKIDVLVARGARADAGGN